MDDDGDGACEGWDLDGDGSPDCSDGAAPGDCDDGSFSLNLMDVDLDGVSSCQQDCDDFEPAVYPGAPEQCDGLDNDCDGLTPPDEVDADADGVQVCAGDCDDADLGVFPGAVEVCNGLDDDCDVNSDEAIDFDGDGVTICAGDCDDGNDAIQPGAAEVCDGLDNDCDGPADEACTSCDLSVPEDFGTIQEAIDAAITGDLVCVLPGTWFETIDFEGKALHLLGAGGAASTVIDGLGLGSVVTFDDGEGSSAVLEGFTITGGDATEGGGIHIGLGSSPSLVSLVVTGNSAATGGGISVFGSSSPSLVGVEVVGNTATDSGGGLRVDGSTLTATDVSISDNTASFGAGIRSESAALDLLRVTIADNIGLSAGGGGGGAYLGASSLDLVDSVVSGNSQQTYGGGLRLVLGTSASLIRTRIVDNAAGGYGARGGGVAVDQSTAALDSVVIAGNWAPSGGGLRVGGGNVTWSGGVLARNGASVGGGVYLIASAALTLWSVSVTGTTAGSAIERDWTAGAVTVSYCNLWGNAGGNVTGLADPVGIDGNVSVDPQFLDTSPVSVLDWDLHLDPTSLLVDAGPTGSSDPSGGPADIGIYGGPDADQWDLDGDGYPSWWQPGPYDYGTYPALGWDCDDQDPTVYPGAGC